MEVVEGKIKADGTTLGHRAKKFMVCTLVDRRRAAPCKTQRSAAPRRNASVRKNLRGTTAIFAVFCVDWQEQRR